MFYLDNLENIKGQNGKVTPFARKKMRFVFDIVECKGLRQRHCKNGRRHGIQIALFPYFFSKYNLDIEIFHFSSKYEG